MTYSFLVIDKKNKLNLNAFNNFLKKSYKNNFEVLYCSTKQRACPEGIKNYVFANEIDAEQILNKTIKKCSMDNICIIRDIKDYKNIEMLTSKLEHDSQIVYFKKQQKGIKSFFDKIITKIINYIFYQNLMPVNYNICVYGKNASKILKNIDKPSYLTRNNLWEGMNFIFVNGGYSYRFYYNKMIHAIKTLIPAIISIVLIFIKIFVNFKAYTYIHMIYYTTVFVCFLISAIFALKWQLARKIGDSN